MLVPMRNLLDKATIEGYGVVAPNVINECPARVCIEAAEELHAPLILDVGYVFHPDLVFLGRMLEEIAVRSSVPIAVNLDHGATYEQVMWALRAGFTSVMIDRSTASFEVNVRDTAEIVKAAHAVQVSVEAELGHVGDGCSYGREACLYTDPIQAVEFVKQTGIDALAVAIGTNHGQYKSKTNINFERLRELQIDFKRIREIRQAVDIPLVLHGGSGSGDANLQKAIQCGISKINIGTDNFAAAIKAGGQAGEPHMVYHRMQQGFKDMVKHYMHIFHQEGKA